MPPRMFMACPPPAPPPPAPAGPAKSLPAPPAWPPPPPPPLRLLRAPCKKLPAPPPLPAPDRPLRAPCKKFPPPPPFPEPARPLRAPCTMLPTPPPPPWPDPATLPIAPFKTSPNPPPPPWPELPPVADFRKLLTMNILPEVQREQTREKLRRRSRLQDLVPSEPRPVQSLETKTEMLSQKRLHPDPEQPMAGPRPENIPSKLYCEPPPGAGEGGDPADLD